jgi:quercetin dioxygenase-like cupin family protein
MNETEILKLSQLNQSIRDAEWNKDTGYMQKVLDDDLLFQRANGTFVDKKKYLEELSDPNNSYVYLEHIVGDVKINEEENKAVVNVIVKASGRRGEPQKPFNGAYRNIRFFRKTEEWQLYAWYNEAINSPAISHIPYGDISYEQDNDGHMCGKAFRENSPNSPASLQTRALYVRFETGAFTKWHWHTGVQILLIKQGIGFVEQKNFPPFDVIPGDRIYIPENVWHRHGAKKGQTMVHLAITNGETKWDDNDTCE